MFSVVAAATTTIASHRGIESIRFDQVSSSYGNPVAVKIDNKRRRRRLEEEES